MSGQINTFNVVITSPSLAAPAVALLEGGGCTLHYTPPFPSAAALADVVARVGADAILARQGPVSGPVLRASLRLKIVARHGVGVDNVDLETAALLGVMVTRTPGANSLAVAEHALALMLAVVKDLRPLGTSIAAGNWRGADTKVRDVAGLRLGVLGYGSIGKIIARLAQGLGMTVSACDPPLPPGGFGTVTRVATVRDLAAASDVLTVHCPLLPATRGLVDASVIAAMPRGSYIVNTARGGIVDEQALAEALESGQLAGAALDVFDDEPPPLDHKLRNHPRLIATPHVAGVTDGSLVAMGVMAAECIIAALTGGTVPAERIVPT